jgi:hypothetical protein
MATSYSQLGILERARDGSAAAAISWHMQALLIRLRFGVPEAVMDLRRLVGYRRELDAELFTSLLDEAVSDAKLAEMIRSLLDEVDKVEDEAT